LDHAEIRRLVAIADAKITDYVSWDEDGMCTVIDEDGTCTVFPSDQLSDLHCCSVKALKVETRTIPQPDGTTVKGGSIECKFHNSRKRLRCSFAASESSTEK